MGGGCETPAAGAAGRGREEGTARAGGGARGFRRRREVRKVRVCLSCVPFCT